jgi:hypothetical protein
VAIQLKDGAPERWPAIPDDEFFEVPLLANLGGVDRKYYYQLAQAGKAPRPRKGVPRSEAISWLKARADEAAARATARNAALAKATSAGTKEGSQK